jgi:hypothetical protein
MALLDALPEFADKLDKQIVSEKIWPHIVSLCGLYNGLLRLTYKDVANRIHRHDPGCP